MTDFLARLRVLLTAAPTYIQTATAVVVIFRDEIGNAVPSLSASVGAWSVTVLAVLVGAANIVRRVSPVLAAERGLLPAGGAPGGQD